MTQPQHVFDYPVHNGALAGGRRVGICPVDHDPQHGQEGDFSPSDAEGEVAAAKLARKTGLPRWRGGPRG